MNKLKKAEEKPILEDKYGEALKVLVNAGVVKFEDSNEKEIMRAAVKSNLKVETPIEQLKPSEMSDLKRNVKEKMKANKNNEQIDQMIGNLISKKPV